MKDVCGNLAETLATADLVVLEVGVVGEEADDLVSPVLVDAVAVVSEWVSVAFAAAALLFNGPRGGYFPTFAVWSRMKKFGFQIFIFCPKFTFWTILSLKILILKTRLTSENLLRIIV